MTRTALSLSRPTAPKPSCDGKPKRSEVRQQKLSATSPGTVESTTLRAGSQLLLVEVRRTSRSSYYVKGLGVAFWGTEPCGAGCWRAPMRSLPGGGVGGVADGSGVGHRSGLLCLGSGHANGAGCQGSGFVVMLV